jgi:glycosyltransferase involved in cell wall biosynthesis
MKTVSLQIEGWRGINHSYALVNQFQILALLKRGDVEIFHRDLPFYRPQWNPTINGCGLQPEDRGKIDAIPPPTGRCDATYRIAFPYRLYGGESGQIFSFGTAEYQWVVDNFIYGGEERDRKYENERVSVVTPSNWSKVGFLRKGFREETVHVVPHGVDPRYFHPLSVEERGEARRKFGIPKDAFAFLNAGAMTGNKGIELLVAAFAQVRRRRHFAVLLLKDQCNLYNIAAYDRLVTMRQQWPGIVDESVLSGIGTIGKNLSLADLRLLYGACDAYVSPYRGEGFNLTPLEAAACGTPIAVTSGGATDDYAQPAFSVKIASRLQNSGDRHLLEPDFESLVACMEALIDRRAAEIDMHAGVAWILENFTWDRAVDKLMGLFL